MNFPSHVAIIMDGNGRWGIKKKNSRNFGHTKGIEVVKNIINAAIKKKINYLTLYTFSTENWKRPNQEIKFLINLLETYIKKELINLINNNIKLKILGNLSKFPKSLKIRLTQAERLTSNNLSKQINEKNISEYLYTKGIPDPEVLIRTGNRKRLSNFLLWQLSYTEIYFVRKLWPDFTINDFNKIISNFVQVKRNFGGIK